MGVGNKILKTNKGERNSVSLIMSKSFSQLPKVYKQVYLSKCWSCFFRGGGVHAQIHECPCVRRPESPWLLILKHVNSQKCFLAWFGFGFLERGWRQSFLWIWNSPRKLTWVAREPQRSDCFIFQGWVKSKVSNLTNGAIIIVSYFIEIYNIP